MGSARHRYRNQIRTKLASADPCGCRAARSHRYLITPLAHMQVWVMQSTEIVKHPNKRWFVGTDEKQ